MWYVLILVFGLWNSCSAMDDDIAMNWRAHREMESKPRHELLASLISYYKAHGAQDLCKRCLEYVQQPENQFLLTISPGWYSSVIVHAFENKLILVSKDASPLILETGVEEISFSECSVFNWWDMYYDIFAASHNNMLYAWRVRNNKVEMHDSLGKVPGVVKTIHQMDTDCVAVFFDDIFQEKRVGFIVPRTGWERTLAFVPVEDKDIIRASNISESGSATTYLKVGSSSGKVVNYINNAFFPIEKPFERQEPLCSIQ